MAQQSGWDADPECVWLWAAEKEASEQQHNRVASGTDPRTMRQWAAEKVSAVEQHDREDVPKK